MLLNGMTKNKQIRGSFILKLPLSLCYKLRRDKHLCKLFHLFQFTLHNSTHFVKFLNALSRSPIMLVQVLQIWITSFKHINMDNIWYNWEGICWSYIFKKSLIAFSLKLRGVAFKILTQLWHRILLVYYYS